MERGEDYRGVLAAAADLTEITQIVRSAARAVTGAQGAPHDVREAW